MIPDEGEGVGHKGMCEGDIGCWMWGIACINDAKELIWESGVISGV